MGKLKLGRMEHKISFYRDQITVNNTTGEQERSVAEVKLDRWAAIKYIGSPSAGASEEEINDQRTGKIKIEITCRFFTGLRFEDFVIFEGGKFRVYSIQTLGRNEGYKLRAELRDDDTPALPTGAVLGDEGVLPITTPSPILSINAIDGLYDALQERKSGIGITGGLYGRDDAGNAYPEGWILGTPVLYTSSATGAWEAVTLSSSNQVTYDVYAGAIDPLYNESFDQTKDLKGGMFFPGDCAYMFQFGGSVSGLTAQYTTDPKWEAHFGGILFGGLKVGDVVEVTLYYDLRHETTWDYVTPGVGFVSKDSGGTVQSRRVITGDSIASKDDLNLTWTRQKSTIQFMLEDQEDLNGAANFMFTADGQFRYYPYQLQVKVTR